MMRYRVDLIVEEIKAIEPRQILLIKVTVYNALHKSLSETKSPVIDERLPFPNSGKPLEFQDKFKKLVDEGVLIL